MLIATRDRREAWLDHRASSSNATNTQKEWSSLWQTGVPSKGENLYVECCKAIYSDERGASPQTHGKSSSCQVCGPHDLWKHALIDFTMSRCVWALVDDQVTEHLSCLDDGNARVWLATLVDTLKEEDQTRVFVTVWAICHARRKAIHENEFQSPLSVHCFVDRFLMDLRQGEVKAQGRTVIQSAAPGPRRIPPPRDVVKINVDGAVGKSHARCSVAAVARSANGELLGGIVSRLFRLCWRRRRLEALACREAPSLAKDIDARRIQAASDCLNVIRSN
jgi:hypothetical protein